MENRVTIYTKFGYASVDLEKYKDELSQTIPSQGSSPERLQKSPSDNSAIIEGGANQNL